MENIKQPFDAPTNIDDSWTVILQVILLIWNEHSSGVAVFNPLDDAKCYRTWLQALQRSQWPLFVSCEVWNENTTNFFLWNHTKHGDFQNSAILFISQNYSKKLIFRLHWKLLIYCRKIAAYMFSLLFSCLRLWLCSLKWVSAAMIWVELNTQSDKTAAGLHKSHVCSRSLNVLHKNVLHFVETAASEICLWVLFLAEARTEARRILLKQHLEHPSNFGQTFSATDQFTSSYTTILS